MAFMDSGISVYLQKRDDQGRDLGEDVCVLKESKKNGLYLVKLEGLKQTTVKVFNITGITIFRESDVIKKSALGRAAVGMVIAGPLGGVIGGVSGTGKKDAWYMELADADGTVMVFRLRNEGDGRLMEKRIRKNGHLLEG